MSVGDSIADLLTRVRNGGMARKRYVEVPKTKMAESLVGVMKECGFIEGFLVRDEAPQGLIRIYLKYRQRIPLIRGLKRISKQSCRRYVGYREIPRVFGGMGVSILSTSQGIMVGHEARKQKVGGEMLCYIW